MSPKLQLIRDADSKILRCGGFVLISKCCKLCVSFICVMTSYLEPGQDLLCAGAQEGLPTSTPGSPPSWRVLTSSSH